MKKTKISGQNIFFNSSEDMSGLKSQSIDFIITSPPYWNLKDYGNKNQIGDSTYKEYLDRMQIVWNECFRVAKDGAIMIININSRRHKKKYYPIAFDIVNNMQNWTLWDHVIWYIPNALPQPNYYIERLLDNKYESCLVFIKGNSNTYTFNKQRVPQKYLTADPRADKKNPKGRCIGNILRIPAYRPPNIKDQGYHVAAYPEELAAFFIDTYTNPKDKVLDPFLGSGTTLKVSRVMDRKGFGYEINDDFSPLIKKRILEEWEVPDWKSIDILHSSSAETGSNKQRKSQFNKSDKGNQKKLI
jgi:modification methylase